MRPLRMAGALGLSMVMLGLVLPACGGAPKAVDASTPDGTPPEKGTPVKTEKATFAAGCFWHVEDTFRKIPGVVDTTVGYTGGQLPNPTYKQVCSDKTGHAEAIEIVFDPEKVSYEELLDVFWTSHNPTTKNRQGPDIGSQYRSAVFYHSPEQQAAAEKSMEKVNQSGRFRNPVVTEITQATEFYPAEDYHQDYYEKR